MSTAQALNNSHIRNGLPTSILSLLQIDDNDIPFFFYGNGFLKGAVSKDVSPEV
jgi:hypothetical protein